MESAGDVVSVVQGHVIRLWPRARRPTMVRVYESNRGRQLCVAKSISSITFRGFLTESAIEPKIEPFVSKNMVIDFVVHIEKIVISGDVGSCADNTRVLTGSAYCGFLLAKALKDDQYLA